MFEYRERIKLSWAGIAVFTILLASSAIATPLAVPNGSFESPVTDFVNTHVDSWQKTAKPSWYDENGPFLWDQLTGVFKNTDPSRPDHIDNCDGNQAMWMFAIPEVGIFQDYDTVDWNHASPTHEFNFLYDVGKSYQLTVGLIGGGGNMLPGATIELSFYYRDSASNLVTVSALSVTNSLQNFNSTTHFVDFNLRIAPVRAGNPWAGQHLGVRLLSTVTTNLEGGYWDIDNVRLSVRNPLLVNPVWTNSHFQLTLQSDPGQRFDILASDDPLLPRSSWTVAGRVTNVTGTVSFTDPTTGGSRRYYQAQEIP